MIQSNLPALVVIVPLLAGLLAPFTGRGIKPWLWATLASWAVLALAIKLVIDVQDQPCISYPVGDWLRPWSIELRVDALNSFVVLIVAAIGAVVTFFARQTVAKEIPEDRHRFFYCVWLLCIMGMLGITITGDAFNVYVLLEVTALSTYTLVAMGKQADRRALTASINYLALGTIGASFILLGIGYLYMVTGTLNMADMAAQLRELYAQWELPDQEPLYQKTVVVAFAFLMVGFSLKLALFPLHGWLPNAYTYAPSAASALLAATATKVGAYVAIRFLFTVLGFKFCFKQLPTGTIMMVLACLGVLFGSYLAIRQTNVKRMLAFSSIGQIGYIALGISLAAPENLDGLTGGIIHLFNHAVTKGGLFLALGAVAYRLGGTDLKNLQGLGRKMPFTMAAFTAGGLGLIGVPLTSGFISKWYLVVGAVKANQLIPAAIVLVGSLLALAYVWRVLEVIYFRPAPKSEPAIKEAPWTMVLPAWILIGASLFFGANASLTSRLAGQAARWLLEGRL